MKQQSLHVMAFVCAVIALGQTTHLLAADEPAVGASIDSSKDSTTITGAAADGEGEGKSIEKVEVTGSHIKRLTVEGASPIVTVTRKELDKSGYNSVSDVLRDAGSSSFGSKREASGSNAAGVATVDLRGLGASNTLVLLNGQRLPSDAVMGAVDLNMIPMAAIERVEILKDGASAIYGSDALGGVVNIITRKDFNGTEAKILQTAPQGKGGGRTDVSVVNGKSTENLNVVTTAQYRDNAAVYARDRTWTAKSTSLIGGPGSYRSAGNPWQADANCPAERLVTNAQGTFCSFNPADYMTKLPQLTQFGMMSEANFQASSNVKMTARVGATQRQVKWSYAAAPGMFVIPAAVADTLGPGGGPLPGATPGQDLQVRYRLLELGTRDSEVSGYSYNALVGSTIQLPAQWQIETSIAHNGVRNSDRHVSGYALTTALQDAIQSGTYNPFGQPGAKGSLDATKYMPYEKTTSLLSSVEVKSSGPLVEMGGGDLSLAVGSTYTHQLYRDAVDDSTLNGEVFANAGSSGSGHRTTQAVFSELSIPLDKKVELSLAGRYDHYSDFGNSANPKAAIMVRPTSMLMLRASAGTGFKAPLMQDMYAATSQGFPTFIDQVACNNEMAAGGDTSSCNPAQYLVTSSGNTGLREEKSISYNVGAVLEPTKSFNIGADVFMARMKNVVGIDYGDVTQAEAQGIDLASRGVIVTRDSNGYIDNIVAPMQNLSAKKISGLDLSSNYRIASFRLSDEHSRLFYYREEGFPGMGLRNKLDENERPRWKNTAAVTFVPNDQHDVTVSALTIAGQQKAVKEMGRLPNYTSYAVNYALHTKKLGTFTVGVKNVLGSTPPLDDSNPGEQLNVELYDQIGRQFLVGYTKAF